MSIENAPYVHFAYKEVMDECNGRLTWVLKIKALLGWI